MLTAKELKIRRCDRMTLEDKRRKVARQFLRRLEQKGVLLKTQEYWIQYEYFFNLQKGRCGICKKSWIEGTTRMHLDHDHQTLEFRGLLCYSCNYKLGFVEKYFKRILKYLGYTLVKEGD